MLRRNLEFRRNLELSACLFWLECGETGAWTGCAVGLQLGGGVGWKCPRRPVCPDLEDSGLDLCDQMSSSLLVRNWEELLELQ